MAKTASVNIRVPEELKDKLQQIAKKKDTSLNDVTSTVLADFAENYELEQVKGDEIPSAKAAKKLLDTARNELMENCQAKIKKAIIQMINNGKSHTFLSLFPLGMDNVAKDEVSKKLERELAEKDYIVHVFQFNFDAPFLENERLVAKKYDIVIGLNEESIAPYLDSEAKAIQVTKNKFIGDRPTPSRRC